LKVWELIEILKEVDPDKDVFFYEMSGFYDTILINTKESIGKFRFDIKCIHKDQTDDSKDKIQ